MATMKLESLSIEQMVRVHGGQGMRALDAGMASTGPRGPNGGVVNLGTLRPLLTPSRWDDFAAPPRGGYETKMGDQYNRDGSLYRYNPLNPPRNRR